MIDAHQHFWRLSRGGYSWMPKNEPDLYRDYEPDDLRPLLDSAGIDQTILVQADDSVAETEFLLELSQKHDWIAGVVGWVDLAQADAPDGIDRLAKHAKLVGIRPMIHDIPDPEWMLDARLANSLAAMAAHDLTFDALVRPLHLPILSKFLTKYSELRVVVDHLAKPDFDRATFNTWHENLAKVAEHPNTYCKISGLLTEAPRGTGFSELATYMNSAASSFGPNRLIFGSDWPVLNLAGTYSEWVTVVQSFCKQHQALSWSELSDTNTRMAYPRIL